MPTSTAKRTVPAAARTSRRGRDRRLEIIKAARDVFLERGFLGASTDEILTRSGGSKETLYAHFGSKLGLFREVITAELQLIFATVTSKAGETPIDGLRLAGRAFVRQAMQPEKIRLMRILIAEGVRIPELTEQLHDTAYVQIKQLFIERIERVQAAGEFTGDSAATLAEGRFPNRHDLDAAAPALHQRAILLERLNELQDAADIVDGRLAHLF